MKKFIILFLLIVQTEWGNTQTISNKYTINWLLAHEPIRVFERAAKNFKDKVETLSNGRIEVKVLTLNDLKNKSLSKTMKRTYSKDLEAVISGDVQMTQSYTVAIGKLNNSFYVLDLPFLFKDHEHAKRVLDGEIGRNLLNSLEQHHLKGLAFTYSGGFRIIATKEKPIEKVEQFKDLKIRISNSPVTAETFRLLGSKTTVLNHTDGVKEVKDKKIDGAETTYARYDKKQQEDVPIINDTQHSLFLTSLVINADFYNKLPDDLKKIIETVAAESAKLEREDSINDEKTLRTHFKNHNLVIFRMPDEELKKMKDLTSATYKMNSLFDTSLIKKIQDQAK